MFAFIFWMGDMSRYSWGSIQITPKLYSPCQFYNPQSWVISIINFLHSPFKLLNLYFFANDFFLFLFFFLNGINSLLHIQKNKISMSSAPHIPSPMEWNQTGWSRRHETWAVGHFNIDQSVLDYSQATLHPKERWDIKGSEDKGKYAVAAVRKTENVCKIQRWSVHCSHHVPRVILKQYVKTWTSL